MRLILLLSILTMWFTRPVGPAERIGWYREALGLQAQYMVHHRPNVGRASTYILRDQRNYLFYLFMFEEAYPPRAVVAHEAGHSYPTCVQMALTGAPPKKTELCADIVAVSVVGYDEMVAVLVSDGLLWRVD